MGNPIGLLGMALLAEPPWSRPIPAGLYPFGTRNRAHVVKTFAAATILFLIMAKAVIAAQGVVVLKKAGCDYYIVETKMGFALLEWYGGNDPDVGDTIVGDWPVI